MDSEAGPGAAVQLRQAVPEDVTAIRRLVREAYAKWVPLIGREPKPMAADYAVAVRDHRFDLLFLQGELAGLVETIDEGERMLVENLAVAPRHQRRGLGARLMAQAEALARSRGCTAVRLYTNQRFTENIALYLRLGYRLDGEQDLGGGTVRVDMSKPL
jgi:GNAT superfamily N-acetyltransferase